MDTQAQAPASGASAQGEAAAALSYGPWFTYKEHVWLRATTVREVTAVGASTHLLLDNGHRVVCKAPLKVVLLALSMAIEAERCGA